MKTSLSRRALIVGGLSALALGAMRPLWAQRVAGEDDDLGTRVEMMDVLPAAKIARGLGFNLKFSNEWEFARAREAGAIEARMQFDWPSVERAPGNLQLTPQMARALDLCVQNNLEPLVIAAYAPLARPIGELTVAGDVPAGSTEIPVRGAALSLVKTPLCHVLGVDGKQIVAEGRWAYYGAFIDSVEQPGTLRLAAKTNRDLPAGTKLRVNQLLYPSVATTDADDPSLVAYGRYARFLASEIAARGLRGHVELWNEPPWIHDRWDARGGFYDTVPPNISGVSPNPGMLDQFLDGPAPPAGVSFVWGGSHKSGGRGLGARRGGVTAAQLQRVSADALHPYGDSPETHAWNPEAMRRGAAFSDLALPGTNEQSNMKLLRQNQLAATRRGQPSPRIVATEIGHLGGDETQKTRYDMRAFLIYLSLGMDRINFYRLADKPGKFGFIDETTRAPKPVFTAFQSFMAQIGAAAGPNQSPITRFDIEDVPAVSRYRGSFPLTVIPIAAPNRWLMVSYQRTFARAGQKWDDVPSPAPASVEWRVPPGYGATKAWNLVSGEAVALASRRNSVSCEVSDDPVAVEMVVAP